MCPEGERKSGAQVKGSAPGARPHAHESGLRAPGWGRRGLEPQQVGLPSEGAGRLGRRQGPAVCQASGVGIRT